MLCGLYQQVPLCMVDRVWDRAYFRTQSVDIDNIVTFCVFSAQQTLVESLLCVDSVLNTQVQVYYIPSKPCGTAMIPMSKMRKLRLTNNCGYLIQVTKPLSIPQADFEPIFV